MFITIDVSKVTNLIISVPTENSSKTLPAICEMFEKNAKFLRVENYPPSLSVEEPEMLINLGGVFRSAAGCCSSEKIEFSVQESNKVIDSFEILTPQVMANFKSERESFQSKIKNLENKISVLEAEIEDLKNCEEDKEES